MLRRLAILALAGFILLPLVQAVILRLTATLPMRETAQGTIGLMNYRAVWATPELRAAVFRSMSKSLPISRSTASGQRRVTRTLGLVIANPRHAARFCSTRAMVAPMTDGFSATVTPAAVRISTFSDALSPKAEMIAPAWPMVRPFGAVRPAI